MLVVAVAVVRMEHPSTAAAFTAAGLDAHAAPEPEEKREGLDPKHASEQKKKLKKQEELWMNHRKKTPPKKLNFSTARFLKYETAADIEPDLNVHTWRMDMVMATRG